MKAVPAPDRSFLGRVFDSYQNMMQIARCVREAGRQRSVERPRVLELSRRDTGFSDYVPEAIIIHQATHENNQPLLDPSFTLPFPDRSFDACLVTDAYEHLSRHARPRLLSEMLRVTHGLVLVGCPNGNELVGRLDRLVFDFIWGKYGESFEPLAQHVGFGLEPVEHVVDSLKRQGADRVAALPGNYVYRWIHQILIFFDLQHHQPFTELYEPINRIYNERLSPYDYREPCYRYLIVAPTDPAIDLDALVAALAMPAESPAAVAEADGVLAKAFRAADSQAAEKLKRASQDLQALYLENAKLRRDNEVATEEIERLKALMTGADGEAEGTDRPS